MGDTMGSSPRQHDGRCDGQQHTMVQWAMRWVAAHDSATGDATGSIAVVDRSLYVFTL